MLNVTKPPVHTYLNNNYYFDSTNSNFKLNKLDELDETADEALQLTVPSLQIDRPGIARSAGKLNRPDLEQPPANLPPIVDQLSDSDQLSEVDQLKEISKLSQLSELNKPAKADDQNSNLRSKLGKMFRKFSNLKASKDDKKKKSSSSSSDKPSKLEKKKPLITVIHKTVTKNNVKLFDASQENAENEDANCVSSKLSSDRRSAAPDRPAHKQRRDESSPNQCSQQSVACQPKSSRSNQSSTQLNSSIQFDDSNLSSLPIDPSPSTNRKIEDVRSRSESKLANCQSRKQAPTKLKSEVDAHELLTFSIDRTRCQFYEFMSSSCLPETSWLRRKISGEKGDSNSFYVFVQIRVFLNLHFDFQTFSAFFDLIRFWNKL